MEITETLIPGLHVLRPRLHEDARGRFIKTFHAGLFAGAGLAFTPREEFYSTSRRGVVRGMHFQLPPAQHAKVVYCPHGRALDVVLDLRRASAAFGRWFACELDADRGEVLFIPAGCAHGFFAREEGSVMVYLTEREHSPEHDAGVRWDSFGFAWPDAAPVVSERDRGLVPFARFDSPF